VGWRSARDVCDGGALVVGEHEVGLLVRVEAYLNMTRP
jgi:hypothetical protein